MTTDAEDSPSVRSTPGAPSRTRKVERAHGPLGFPCAPDPRPAALPPTNVPAPVPVSVLAPQPPRVVTSSTQRIGHGSIAVYAGADALAELRDAGLRPERLRSFIAASGGPKWLVLHGIDRALFPWLLQRAHAPLHVLGSSIGSWRAATLATRDPLGQLEQLCHTYIEQRFNAADARVLDAALGPEGVAPLLSHPRLRLHIVTARTRLGLPIERVVFDADGEPAPFAPWQGLRTAHVPLTELNALAALQASAAMPAMMDGFGSEIDAADGFTLYPRVDPQLAPGWLDKPLPWQRARGLRRTIVIAPSAQHLASLPGGKLPDRNDFLTMSDRDRVIAWRHVVALGHAMGYQLMELLESDRIRHVVQPLT